MLIVPLLIALMLSIGCGPSLSEEEAIQLVRNHIKVHMSQTKDHNLGKFQYDMVKQTNSHWRIGVMGTGWCVFTVNKATHLVAETGECSLMEVLRR